jgi:hypothetical protein
VKARTVFFAVTLLSSVLAQPYPLPAQTPDDQFLFERSLDKLIHLGYAVMKEYDINPFRASNMMKEYSSTYSKLFPPPRAEDWSCMLNQVIDFSNPPDVRFEEFDPNYVGMLCTHTSEGASSVNYILMLPRTEQNIEKLGQMGFSHDILFNGDFIDETERLKYLDKMISPSGHDPATVFNYMVIKAGNVRYGSKHQNF